MELNTDLLDICVCGTSSENLLDAYQSPNQHRAINSLASDTRFRLHFCQRPDSHQIHSTPASHRSHGFEKLNVLSATAGDLRNLLQAKQASSVQLVKAYLRQIAKHDVALKAFICLAPEKDVLASAASLDNERLEGRVRSQLHGVPVVLKVRSSYESGFRTPLILTVGKDCFVSAADLGMSTTADSWALVGAKASKNSAMVQKMIEAGLIILGKTNMTVRKSMTLGELWPC